MYPGFRVIAAFVHSFKCIDNAKTPPSPYAFVLTQCAYPGVVSSFTTQISPFSMETSATTKRPPSIPVCERCRRRRQKCETAELKPCRSCVGAGVECLISDPENQNTSLPRTYIRQLEERAEQLRQRVQGARNLEGHSQIAQLREHQIQQTPNVSDEFPIALSPDAASESLIENLFNNHSRADSGLGVKSLVQDLGQVSLSALTAHGTDQPHTGALRSLIMSMATPNVSKGNCLPQAVPLPGMSITQRVCARYCKDVLPSLPFTTPSAILEHLQAAYEGSSVYSTFLIGTTLATTAVYLSPASLQNAAGLYRTALSFLELWFNTHPETDMLQYLETVIVLGQFASIIGYQYADSWALGGLAVRIAVDLGLHKVCETDQKRRLFWSAYALDRKRAILDDLPVAVPERAIDTEMLKAPQNYPFELYRLMYEIHAVKDPADQAWQQSIQMRLGGWNQAYRENNDSPCRLLEADHDLAIAKFHHKIS